MEKFDKAKVGIEDNDLVVTSSDLDHEYEAL